MMNETKVGKDAAAPGSMDEQIARIIEQAQVQGLQLTGEGGLLPDIIKQAVEAALHAEMADPWDTTGMLRRGGGRGTHATG